MRDNNNIVRTSEFATQSNHKSALVINDALLKQKADDSLNNSRLREIHNFHLGNEDNLQRMLNALQPNSYIRPHRHILPTKPETLIVLKGSVGSIIFDDSGSEKEYYRIDPKCGEYGIDYRGGIWHTYFALEPNTVIFEVKPGPFDARSDKEFADWAPAEGSDLVKSYFDVLVLGLNKHFQRNHK